MAASHGEPEEDGEAHTLGLLRELREMAEDIGHGHVEYADRFQKLLNALRNPNLHDVAKELSFQVTSYRAGTRERERVISLNGHITVARAA